MPDARSRCADRNRGARRGTVAEWSSMAAWRADEMTFQHAAHPLGSSFDLSRDTRRAGIQGRGVSILMRGMT
jgi:hypothetical protein